MLQLASTAKPKDRTERLRALPRHRKDFDKIRDCVPLLDFFYLYPRALSRQRPKAKDHDTLGTSDTLPVGKKITEEKFELGARYERVETLTRCVAARQAP